MVYKRIHDLYYGKLFGNFFKLLAANLLIFVESNSRRCQLFNITLDHLTKLHFEAFLIERQEILHGRLTRKARLDDQIRFLADKFDGLEILRVKHRHLEIPTSPFKSNNIMRSGNWLGDCLENLRINLFTLKIYERDTENIALDAFDITRREFPRGNQNIPKPLTGLF